MTNDFVSRINWLDVLALIILVRTVYIGMKTGIVTETFKLAGVFATIIIALHYYPGLASFMKLPKDIGFFLAYITLSITIVLSFKFIREGLLVLVKVEAHSLLDRWGGLLIGLIRGVLVCSLVVLGLRLTNANLIRAQTKTSVTGNFFARITPRIYESCYNSFITKMFPAEKLNKHVLAVGYGRDKKDQKQ